MNLRFEARITGFNFQALTQTEFENPKKAIFWFTMIFYASEFTFKSTIFFSQLQGARWIPVQAPPNYEIHSNAYNGDWDNYYY